MAMGMLGMILALGMPIITIILIIMTASIRNIFQENKNLIWGLIISLGLFNIAMILDHTGTIAQPFLMWSHIVLPIGASCIYLGLKK